MTPKWPWGSFEMTRELEARLRRIGVHRGALWQSRHSEKRPGLDPPSVGAVNPVSSFQHSTSTCERFNRAFPAWFLFKILTWVSRGRVVRVNLASKSWYPAFKTCGLSHFDQTTYLSARSLVHRTDSNPRKTGKVK